MKKLIIAVLFLTGCSASHVPDIKEHAASTLKARGFEIVGYEGYQWGSFETFGGRVWYSIRRIPDNGILYEVAVTKWGDEYHLYNLAAIDAIKPAKP